MVKFFLNFICNYLKYYKKEKKNFFYNNNTNNLNINILIFIL